MYNTIELDWVVQGWEGDTTQHVIVVSGNDSFLRFRTAIGADRSTVSKGIAGRNSEIVEKLLLEPRGTIQSLRPDWIGLNLNCVRLARSAKVIVIEIQNSVEELLARRDHKIYTALNIAIFINFIELSSSSLLYTIHDGIG